MVKQKLERDEQPSKIYELNTEKIEVDFSCMLVVLDKGGEKA